MRKNLLINELYAKPDVLLIDHILDVGYIAEALMKYGRAYTMIQAINKDTKIDFATLVNSIAWLCALHDIGKAHPKFVTKMYATSTNEKLIEIYENLKEKNLVKDGDYSGFRHERFSRDILKDYFEENYYPEDTEIFANLVAYHHQGKDASDFSDRINLKDEDWTKAHKEIISQVNKIWNFDKSLGCISKNINGILYSILSIMVTADWIASGSKWHESVTDDKQACAKKFIEENELSYIPMSKRFKDIKWSDIFIFSPNNMQSKVITAAKENPYLTIIEYPCGGGKTEAALSAAINMGANKSGIYIATPTMSTAKGMALRMNELAKKANLDINIPEFDSSTLWSDEDMLKVPNYLWTSKSRHRMLYPFAVGTIDQILKTMLYYRYACIGLMGLSDKVLIIDEVHAYDSYMLSELKMLLQWCRFLEIPVILLSATLPTITKNELLKAVGCKETKNISDYPLITTFGKDGCKYIPIDYIGRKFKINIIEAENYNEAWENELTKNYNGCNAFIKGTVDNTWELFKISKTVGNNTIMFQGRDTLKHKEDKTTLLLNILGKDRTNRPEKLSLVATSIIEQSLDIDLDRMFTCIAPIDLLIQRFGRVWRHSDIGTIRENEIIDNPITIIIPKDKSKLISIYSSEILNRTIKVISDLSELDTVADARRLIDEVYDSKELIDDMVKLLNVGTKRIEPPTRDAMFDNAANFYSKFRPIQSETRFETFPTVSIGIVEKSDITGIEDNYDKIKKVMRENVVGISLMKAGEIRVDPITFKHKLISDVRFYLKDDLANQNIELLEDGLKWNNN